MSTVNHVFYEVHMGIGHRGCQDLLSSQKVEDDLPKNHAAVFLNRHWTAAKILLPGNMLLYWRSPTGSALTPEQLRFLPSRLANTRLAFGGKLENGLIGRWNKDVNKAPTKRIKIA